MRRSGPSRVRVPRGLFAPWSFPKLRSAWSLVREALYTRLATRHPCHSHGKAGGREASIPDIWSHGRGTDRVELGAVFPYPMDFEIIGDIAAIEPIALGRGIRDRR